MRAGVTQQADDIEGRYNSEPIESLLRMATEGTRPWDAAPSFSYGAVARAAAKARHTPNLLVSVWPSPWWMIFWPFRDQLSVLAQPLPTAGDAWTGYTVLILSSSWSLRRLVANLAIGLEGVGSDSQQLVTSLEQRLGSLSRFRHHLIACIPGSR